MLSSETIVMLSTIKTLESNLRSSQQASLPRKPYFSENSAQEEVVQSVVCVEETRVGIWVELLVGGVLEETTIGIKASFQQFPDEFAEQTAAINARLVGAGEVDQLYLHAKPQIRLYICLTEK